MIVTIDGPVASGKSTVSYRISKKLSFYYLNSGLLFRALAYVFLYEYGLKESELINVSYQEVRDLYFNKKILYKYNVNFGVYISFNQADITMCLRDLRVEQGASIIAKNSAVRQALLEYQHLLANNYSIIAEGRDAGTMVFPNADIKFFITASSIIRAKRWQANNKSKNIIMSFPDSLNFIQERDKRDINRSIAPLMPALDAIIIDNTKLSISQTVNIIMQYINKKLKGSNSRDKYE